MIEYDTLDLTAITEGNLQTALDTAAASGFTIAAMNETWIIFVRIFDQATPSV